MDKVRLNEIAFKLLLEKLEREMYGENLAVGLRQRFEQHRPEGVSEVEFETFLGELAAQMWATEPDPATR